MMYIFRRSTGPSWHCTGMHDSGTHARQHGPTLRLPEQHVRKIPAWTLLDDWGTGEDKVWEFAACLEAITHLNR